MKDCEERTKGNSVRKGADLMSMQTKGQHERRDKTTGIKIKYAVQAQRQRFVRTGANGVSYELYRAEN